MLSTNHATRDLLMNMYENLLRYATTNLIGPNDLLSTSALALSSDATSQLQPVYVDPLSITIQAQSPRSPICLHDPGYRARPAQHRIILSSATWLHTSWMNGLLRQKLILS